MSHQPANVRPLHLNRDAVTYAEGPYRPQSQPRPRPNFSHSQEGGHKRFVAKGHDAQLQDAQHGKAPVVITTINDAIIRGTISRRDKWTITVLLDAPSSPGQELMVYKHAIESVLIAKTQ